jgi:hypothetical protein
MRRASGGAVRGPTTRPASIAPRARWSSSSGSGLELGRARNRGGCSSGRPLFFSHSGQVARAHRAWPSLSEGRMGAPAAVRRGPPSRPSGRESVRADRTRPRSGACRPRPGRARRSAALLVRSRDRAAALSPRLSPHAARTPLFAARSPARSHVPVNGQGTERWSQRAATRARADTSVRSFAAAREKVSYITQRLPTERALVPASPIKPFRAARPS